MHRRFIDRLLFLPLARAAERGFVFYLLVEGKYLSFCLEAALGIVVPTTFLYAHLSERNNCEMFVETRINKCSAAALFV